MFHGLNLEASMRHGEGQLCAHVDVTGSESDLNMVCLRCDNVVAAKL